MARLLPRSPTPHEEFAFEQWCERFLWNDYRCDHCEALLPEDNVHTHDVYDRETGKKIPVTHYCSRYCYAKERAPYLIEQEKV